MTQIQFAHVIMTRLAIAVITILLAAAATSAADRIPSNVKGLVVVPAMLTSFEKMRLEIKLWEHDPRLADVKATLFDEVVVKDYTHTKGKETRTAFSLGEKVNGGKTNAGKAYYLTVFVTQGDQHTHIGEKDGKPGMTKVLTDGNPNDVTLALRAIGQQKVAQKKPVKPTKMWQGSVEDEKLAKDAPVVLTSSKALAKLWKDWKLTDKMPDVDFKKQLVVVTTTRGSKLRLALTLDERGDLQVGGIATRDFRPGFRYIIATVNNEGVKSVNGKALPKE
jgi:hypothetical protein